MKLHWAVEEMQNTSIQYVRLTPSHRKNWWRL